MQEIIRVVMPPADFIDNTELFVNKEDNECYINGKLANVNEYKFNTWMNLFAAKKYYYYCDLGNVYLDLKIKGQYKLQITGSNRNFAFDRIDNVILSQDCDGDTCVQIPYTEKYEGIYFTIIEDKANPIEFYKASYCSDREVNRDNKLAIVTCTFKREDYINKNIRLFERFIEQNPELNDKIKLIVVDNGKTLDVNRSNDKVKIIPNMNAGGAGGFTRGLMDVMEQNVGFTRVLFMDDDVEIFPESFYRTLILSNYLKEEFKDSFINGAMLDLYDKSKFFENISMQHGLWLTGYYNNLDVTEYNNILKTNDIPPEIFGNRQRYTSSAWWYCSFPLDFAKNNGLSIPIFFRGDDAEWSWRACGVQIISMNGICIWHAAFEWRVSKVADYYYLPRNMFFLNSIYNRNFKTQYSNYFKERYNYLIKTYEYTSLDLLLKSMKDILKGSNIFRENPEEQFKNVNQIAKQVEYRTATNDEIETAKNGYFKSKKWRKKLVKYIDNSFIKIPKFLFKKHATVSEWYPPVEAFALVREVAVVNLFTNKTTIRRYDRKKTLYYKKEFYKLLKQIDSNYDKLHTDYINAHKEFSTFEFWEKYLELK